MKFHLRRAVLLLPVLLLSSAVATVLLAPPLAAQATKVEEIEYPELPAFDIPEPERHELSNGMTVLLLEDHELPLVEVSAFIRTGSRLEPADKTGLAELTGDVLRTGGTESMTGDELDDFLEAKAASIETSIGTQSGQASMSSLKDDFPEVLEVFADVLRNPVFEESKIEVAKTSLEASIARQNDNPQQILFREFTEVIYGDDSPYTREPTYASVGKVTRDDLIAWHEKYYHPDRIILGLVGDFDSDEALELIEGAFGDWPRGPEVERVDVPYDTQPKPGVYYVEKNDMTQSNIAMGHIGIRRDNPDYHAIEVMNQVMSGSFASRLFTRIRSEQGLAYSVFGQVGSQWDRQGVTVFGTTTKTETTGAALESLIREANNATAEPFTQEEVDKAKAGILNSFIFNSDSRSEILNQQLTFAYHGYPLDWLSRYREGIDGVSLAEVREAAAEYLHPEHFSILVVGPSEGRDRPLSDFGEVVELDITIPEPEAERAAVSEEGMARAGELLDLAVESLGGETVDTANALRTSGTALVQTPQGEMQLKLTTTLRFPDSLRQDAEMPMGKMSMVVTPADAFVQMGPNTRDLPGAQREALAGTVRRNPLMLLRARTEPGFEATTTGSAEVDGTTVELVQVDQAGELTTLGIDPRTGRILRLSFQGPGPSGAPGNIVQSFGDFRDVEGMAYPYAVVGTFNGEPTQTITLEEVEVDPELEESTFERPEG